MKRFLFCFDLIMALSGASFGQPLKLVTPVELTIVRQRITANSPYVNVGDVCANSPGDWADIQTMRDAFVADPFKAGDTDAADLNLWTPRANYAPDVNSYYPQKQLERAQAAAQYYALYPSEPYAKACGQLVKELLLKQVAVGGWSSGSNWPLTTSYYGGSQESGWLVRFCYCREYIKPLLSASELSKIDAWLDGWGTYLYARQLGKYVNYLPNWATGDLSYRRSYASAAGETSNPVADRIYAKADQPYMTVDDSAGYYVLRHVGSTKISIMGKFMDNPDDMKADAVFTIGVVRGNGTWLRHADTYFKAKLIFWLWPDGTNAEWHRNGRQLYAGAAFNPGFGAHNYGNMGLQVLTHQADVRAKNGDYGCYTYSTTDGVHGSQCGSGQPAKSLLTLCLRVANNVNGTDLKYWRSTSDSRNVIDHKSRYNLKTINGQNWPYESVSDYLLASANRYYNNATLRQAYLRTGQGYGLNRATAGIAPYNWGGAYSALIGFNLRYGQTENLIYGR